MNLYKNGYVVAEINRENRCYHAWPLADIANDKIAEALTNEADENWFIKYEMQHIVPDLNYVRVYSDYCNSIHLQVEVLLFESVDDNIIIDDKPEISEVLGFDCIGTVYYSYLQTEYNDFEAELSKKNIFLNRHGLLDSLEDALYFAELRRAAIDSGVDLEDFWKELPVKISIIKITPGGPDLLKERHYRENS